MTRQLPDLRTLQSVFPLSRAWAGGRERGLPLYGTRRALDTGRGRPRLASRIAAAPSLSADLVRGVSSDRLL